MLEDFDFVTDDFSLNSPFRGWGKHLQTNFSFSLKITIFAPQIYRNQWLNYYLYLSL